MVVEDEDEVKESEQPRLRPTAWKFTDKVTESHQAPIYCLAFNFIDPRHKDVFATVGRNQATVYQCLESGEMEPLQVYIDPDRGEEFFTCAWSINEETGAAVLLIAGHRFVIRVLDLDVGNSVHTFVGHGNAINDIKVHPQQPALFLTASKDESLRLWNMKSKTCLLVFHGDGGHRNEVLSIDFHSLNPFVFASCGMDNMVKIWSYERQAKVVEDSFHPDAQDKLTTRYVQYPIFSSSKVHGNYVDCVRWLGETVLSKSVDSRVILWRPDLTKRQANKNSLETVEYLQEYLLSHADVWFLRFSFDYHFKYMAVGNRKGKVFVYDLFKSTQVLQKLMAPGLKSPVRQTAVSFDGSIILCSCEDSSVYRWDATAFATDCTERSGPGGQQEQGK